MVTGVIGIGRLGSSLVRGFINGGIKPREIYVYDISIDVLKRIESLGIVICRSVDEVVESSNIIIIAVKPQDITSVVKYIGNKSIENKIIVSVAAFVPLGLLEKYINKNVVYRAMPNIAVEINKGFTALAPIDRRNLDVEELFKVVGDVVWVREEILDLLTIISASTPAVIAELIDSFMLAALKAGIPYDIAKNAIASVFHGIGKLFGTKDFSSIRDSVITPRGSTIILIEKLYTYEVKNRLIKALIDSIEEYLEKLNIFRKSLNQ